MSSIPSTYQRIYLDSNILIRAKWPLLGQTMRTALETASFLSLPVILLQSVERELRAHSLRQLGEARAAVAGKVRELNGLCEPLGIKGGVSVPLEDELAEAYDKCVDENVAAYELIRSAPSLRTTAELFDMAIHKRKPFSDKGRNFQDAVICLAAIDDLVQSRCQVGAFVSRDEIFDQRTLDKLCLECGITMYLFKSEETLNDDMRRFLRQQMATEWLEDEELARKAVNSSLPALQGFIEANLEIPSRLRFTHRILRIKHIQIKQIDRVETPPPWDRPPNEPVTITAKMTVQVLATLRRPSPSSPATEVLKVGAISNSLRGRIVAPFFVEQEEVLERTVDIELKAQLADGVYGDLEPVSVALGNPAATRNSGFTPVRPEMLHP